jgi:hypothetical protein
VYDARTRMVSFRVSEDEYERLKDMSLQQCARSVSEFARFILCKQPAAAGASGEGNSPRMDKLEGALRQLRLDMNQLRQIVETTLGRVVAPPETASIQENNQ